MSKNEGHTLKNSPSSPLVHAFAAQQPDVFLLQSASSWQVRRLWPVPPSREQQPGPVCVHRQLLEPDSPSMAARCHQPGNTCNRDRKDKFS